MPRVRISTTVDGARLDRARALLGTSDSDLVDRALTLLVEAAEAERETEILARLPYESDPDLAWEPPSGPSLPYDGPIPDDVKALSRRVKS